MNNKILLGAIGLIVLVAGLGIGYLIPKTSNGLGQVSYDKQYFSDTYTSGTSTVKNLEVSGNAIFSGIATTTVNPILTSLTVTGASALSGSLSVGTTLGVTGTSTFSGQVGIAKCMTALTSAGQTVYLTFATTTGSGTVTVTSTKPSVCY